MDTIIKKRKPGSNMVTFYHDIEQNISCKANPEECRRMVKEFLKLEKKYDIPVTYNVAGKLFREQPDLIEWILQEGKEVAFHSYNHQSNWRPEYYSDEIDLCRKVSPIPHGYRSPRSEWNQTTLRTLWEKGFLWNAESDTHKVPYFIYKGLVRLPIATDDWPVYERSLTFDEWIREFSNLLKNRPYFAIGSHDCTTSFTPEEALKAWERVLQIAIENKALVVTFSEAADLFRRAMLSRYCSISFKNWNQDTKTRIKHLQEMIRAEARKLNQPVIAALGSVGGMLSSPLKEIAKKIYRIDNTPGIVADLDSDNCIQTCLGEVTDSNLSDSLVDLVICAGVIEYLFWPNRLADEIKRIGKIGATYFITFPGSRVTPHSQEASPPDRIRHYFTPDEIQDWAKQIGPGRLIDVQYQTSIPHNTKTEQCYSATQKNPSLDPCPTTWVYIGTIRKKLTRKDYRKTIPVSAFDFSSPIQKYDHLKLSLRSFAPAFPKPIRRLLKRILYR